MRDPGEIIAGLNEGVDLFAADMKRQGIHVGIGLSGGAVVCAVDGEAWPCSSQPSWRVRAERALHDLAATGRPFTADDLIGMVGHPDDSHQANAGNNQIGAVFRDAAKEGLIVGTGYARSRQPRRKGGMIRVWEGR
jgi:hypothetical protein